MSETDLVDRIRLPPPEDCPPLTLLLGPCRSGTTALLRAAAAAGNVAVFQPIKRLVRLGLLGKPGELTIRPGTAPIVVKETFGPFLLDESSFDPLGVLLRRGYPRDRINVVVMLRDAGAMYRSWCGLYTASQRFGAVRTDVYLAAWWNAIGCHRRARAATLRSTAFVADGFEAGTAEYDVLAVLFRRCGWRFGPEAVDWRRAGRQLDESIERQPEPEVFRARGALAAVRSSTRYRLLRGGSTDPADVPDEVLRLRGVYEEFRSECLANFGRDL